MKQLFFAVLILGCIGSLAQKMPVYLTFTASNNGQHVSLNSVYVENLTGGGDTTIYAPDTVLVLDYIVNIDNNLEIPDALFTISQNYPNPIKEKTTIKLYLSENKKVLITIHTLQGKLEFHKEFILSQGHHEFIFSPGMSSVYVLTVLSEKSLGSIKMINHNTSSGTPHTCELEHTGLQSIETKDNINKCKGFGYNPGDVLRYTASTPLGSRVIQDAPVGNQLYVFQYTSRPPCPGTPTVTDNDGNIYNTVLIGTQCWMKENLKTTTYSNGAYISNVPDDSIWNNLTTGAYVWYDNDISWKNLYGAIYNWFSVVDSNGLCPSGWHVPSRDNWWNLQYHIGGANAPYGNDLKSCRQVSSPLAGSCSTDEHPRWNQDSTNYGTDYYGFSGTPGGYRNEDGHFGNIGKNGYWWSSTETWTNTAKSRSLNYMSGNFSGCNCIKERGFSVRCIKD